MPNKPVTSREYKLMLNVDRFQDRGLGAGAFFELLKFLIEKEGGPKVITKEQIKDKEKRRQTSYLDTPELALRQAGFALRLREESGGDFQLNLKYRAADRYFSAAQDLTSTLKGKPKFEEDVLPPFVSKFSHSISLASATPFDVDTVRKLTAVFPGLQTLGLDADVAVRTINNFRADEVVRDLCKFQFGGEPPELKAGLSFWYLPAVANSWPLVVEFSFDYDADKGDGGAGQLEEYPVSTVEGANRLFAALQGQAGWFNPNGTTKTAFALEVL